MAVKIIDLNEIEVKIGHISSISNDEYGNSSMEFSAFPLKLPPAHDKGNQSDFLLSKVVCPICKKSFQIILWRTRLSIINPNSENREILKKALIKQTYGIVVTAFLIIEFFHWGFSYIMKDSGSFVIPIHWNIAISVLWLLIIVLIAVGYASRKIKTAVENKEVLLISETSLKKYKGKLITEGTFNAITQVNLDVGRRISVGDHVIVGENREESVLIEDKIVSGTETSVTIEIDEKEYLNYIKKQYHKNKLSE